jgi:hypothetical protein
MVFYINIATIIISLIAIAINIDTMRILHKNRKRGDAT